MKSTTLKCNSNLPNDIIFHIYQHQLVPKKKKTANIWKYIVGNIGNFANLERL